MPHITSYKELRVYQAAMKAAMKIFELSYRAAFISKLSDSETEAEETRVWLEFSWRCGYIAKWEADELVEQYDRILKQLVCMIDRPEQWLIVSRR